MARHATAADAKPHDSAVLGNSITLPNPRASPYTYVMFETIHAAAEAIRQKPVTPLDLLDQCLAQIDRWESKVRAWVFIDRERARADAARLTDELKRRDYRGP